MRAGGWTSGAGKWKLNCKFPNYSEYSYSAVFGEETKLHCVKTALFEQNFMLCYLINWGEDFQKPHCNEYLKKYIFNKTALIELLLSKKKPGIHILKARELIF